MADCASCGCPTNMLYSHMGESAQCWSCFKERWGVNPVPSELVKSFNEARDIDINPDVLCRNEEDEGPTSQPEDPRPDRDTEGGF